MSGDSESPLGLEADLPGTPITEPHTTWLDELPNSLLQVISTIAEIGEGVWLVGGAVRQGMAGSRTKDYDLTTTLEPQKLLKLFRKSLPTGVEYGTVTVRLESGTKGYEVTTLRSDQEYADGRRPDAVVFGRSLAEDLARRDLTINAMAVDVSRRMLYDPFDGLADLESRCLRAVGDPIKRLGEDGLRIMRVYRFMDQGEAGIWLPEEDLASALIASQDMLSRVSVERIWDELSRILQGFHAHSVLNRMQGDGILDIILGPGTTVADQKSVCSANPLVVRLALLLRRADVDSSLRRLKVSNKVLSSVQELSRRLGHLPDPSNEASLRVYRAALASTLRIQLDAEVAIDEESALPVLAALESLAPNRAGESPLAEGNWIAQVTGLEPGVRLGRLKAWLHRIQIEDDLYDLSEVEVKLKEIDWEKGDPLTWPSLSWP